MGPRTAIEALNLDQRECGLLTRLGISQAGALYGVLLADPAGVTRLLGRDRPGMERLRQTLAEACPELTGQVAVARACGLGLRRGEAPAVAAPRSLPWRTQGLPKSVDLAKSLMPVRDQGNRPTCVAFAATAMWEHIVQIEEKLEEPFSPQHLYCRCKEEDGFPGGGTHPAVALALLSQDGVCRESVWPYDPLPQADEGQGPVPAPAARDGIRFCCGAGAALVEGWAGVAELRACLAGGAILSGRPVLIGVEIHRTSFFSPWVQRTGEVTLPLPLPGEESEGCHALTVVGYDDGRQAFLVRNSWGAGWAWEHAHPGHCWLPYTYVAEHGIGAWTALTRTEVGLARPVVALPRARSVAAALHRVITGRVLRWAAVLMVLLAWIGWRPLAALVLLGIAGVVASNRTARVWHWIRSRLVAPPAVCGAVCAGSAGTLTRLHLHLHQNGWYFAGAVILALAASPGDWGRVSAGILVALATPAAAVVTTTSNAPASGS